MVRTGARSERAGYAGPAKPEPLKPVWRARAVAGRTGYGSGPIDGESALCLSTLSDMVGKTSALVLNFSRTVGWFPSIALVLLELPADAPSSEVLNAVRQQ